MSDRQKPARPIGWWLKEADTLLDAAFDTALRGHDVDRRGWQVLATLARQPTSSADLLAALARFDPPDVVQEVLHDLRGRGWVEETPDRLRLTAAGAARQQALAPLVDGVRQRVSAALPPEDYQVLVGLLARLVEGLGGAAQA